MWYYVYRISDGVYTACSLDAQLSQFDPALFAWVTTPPPSSCDFITQKSVWSNGAWTVQDIT